MDDTAPGPIDAPPPRRSRRVILIAVSVAFLLGLAAMTLLTRGYERWFGTEQVAQPATVAAPVQQSGQSTFSPAAPLSASGAKTADLDQLQAREVALGGRIAELEVRLANTATAAQSASGDANRAEGLLIAFAARRALDRGLGLGYIEGQLRERFGSTQPQAVATVIAASRQPVTLEDLREGILAITPQLKTGNTTDGWWASLRREVSDLIVVRRDNTPSPRADDRLVRARRMLDAGQVEGALAEVARLPGAEAGDRWIAAARRYTEARRALDGIETAAILGQGRDPAVRQSVVVPAPAPGAEAAAAVTP